MTHKNYDSYQTRHLPETPRESDRHLLDLVERFAARDRPTIDLGCSTGNFLGLIKESSGRLGMPLVGIDISESSLELAQKNLPDIDFHLFNILEFTSDSLPISRGGGANIIANAYFNEAEFHQAMKNLKTFLRNGARLFVFDRFSPFEQDIKITERSSWYPDEVTFYYRSLGDLSQILDSLGLRIFYDSPFEISLDLQFRSYSNLESYTVPLGDGKKMIMRGVLNQPWYHLVIGEL